MMQKVLLITHRNIDKVLLNAFKTHVDIDLFSTETIYEDVSFLDKLTSLPHKNKTDNSIFIDMILETHQLPINFGCVKYITLIGSNVKNCRLPGLIEGFLKTWPNNLMIWEEYNHNYLEQYLQTSLSPIEISGSNSTAEYKYYLDKVKLFLKTVG